MAILAAKKASRTAPHKQLFGAAPYKKGVFLNGLVLKN